ncbi:MAG: penicillin-insensitive murein endopeptidase [Bradymonadaceae bacterium]|nr:penicillin-insensitive murein endopeptidase [Lujinxingiaceae bacterium]
MMAASLMLAGMVVSTPASSENKPQDDLLYYTVSPEDTLGAIALRFKVGINDLLGWNKLDSIAIVADTTLIVRSAEVIKPPAPVSKTMAVVHTVRAGDTFEAIAKRHRVSVQQIQQWNRRVNPRRLQIGQQVRLQVPNVTTTDGRSTSWGAANGGRLYNGVALQDSPGLRVRNQARAFGTKRTINLLEGAGADIKARWPDAPDMVVGSLSQQNGGRMRPHKSHQSGRDVDLAFYHRGNIELPDFRNMTPETFDAVKNWHLLKILIDTSEVEYVFIDYRLQKVLHEYGLSIGYSAEELEPLIQYPHGQNASNGLIRHARGHLNHAHIRFRCGPEDSNCR